jgi:hypothetical protein
LAPFAPDVPAVPEVPLVPDEPAAATQVLPLNL